MSCKKSKVDFNKKRIQEIDSRGILKNVFGLFILPHNILNHTTENISMSHTEIQIQFLYCIDIHVVCWDMKIYV